jgi:LPXTG-site transpeptidase (sortase) family protein
VRLAKINTLLLIGIVIVNLYIIAMPFMPGIIFRVQQHRGRQQQLQQALHSPLETHASINETGNRLVVPAMLLDVPINEGAQNASLSKGLWRIPTTSTPDKGGNTVIVGHRFTYTNPEGVFYNLNQVKVGDEIGVFWQGKRYIYTVNKTEVVPPTDTSVQAPTNKAEVTLYTCTPLWLPKNRLVVIASEEAS